METTYYYMYLLSGRSLDKVSDISSKACFNSKALLDDKSLTKTLGQAIEAGEKYNTIANDPSAMHLDIEAAWSTFSDTLEATQRETHSRGEERKFPLDFVRFSPPEEGDEYALKVYTRDAIGNYFALRNAEPAPGAGAGAAYDELYSSLTGHKFHLDHHRLDGSYFIATANELDRMHKDWWSDAAKTTPGAVETAEFLRLLSSDDVSYFASNNFPQTFSMDVKNAQESIGKPSFEPGFYTTAYVELESASKTVHDRMDLLDFNKQSDYCFDDISMSYENYGD